MKKIEEIRPNLFVVKTKKGYRQVFPIKKDLDKPFTWGNTHWFNFLTGGNVGRLVTTLLILACLITLSILYLEGTEACRELMENPHKICGGSFVNRTLLVQDINISDYNETYNLFIPSTSDVKIITT